MTRRRVLAASSTLAIGLALAACGSEGNEIAHERQEPANIKRGAKLFAERCSGCHTMKVAGAQGGATKVHDRERTDGPSFDTRRETVDSVLYAIRNGGFSGAIMPENIVVGQEAADVAAFLAKYAGGPRRGRDITPASQPTAAGGGGGTETTTTGQQETQTATSPGGDQQASERGKQVFTQNCAGCHTLKDAGANGQVGPNLDDVQPEEQAVQRQVENGGGAMPAFAGRLPDRDIQAVSAYVASVAGK